MSVVSGVVGKINSRQFNGKNFHSFALNGQDGWYGTGLKRPPREGTAIRFVSKTNTKGYLEVDGLIEVLEDQSPSTASVSTASASSAGSNGYSSKNSGAGDGGKDAYWRGKEARDVTNDALRELGASRNTAISLIDLAIKNEVITLPAKAKREEFLWTLLNKYTDRLMGKGAGDKEVEKLPEGEPLTEELDDSETWT